MATTTSPAPDDRTNKRIKQDEGGPPGSQQLAPLAPPPPPQQRYPPPQYGGGPPPPPHMPPGGYYGGPPPPQYGGHVPPPHHWQGGPPPPPGGGRYPPPGPPPRGLSPDRMAWQQHGYRDPPPPKGRKLKQQSDKEGDPYYSHGPPPPPPHAAYPGPPPPPGYGPPPPVHWQGGPPPPGPPPHHAPMYASQGTWTGKTPPRGSAVGGPGRLGRGGDPYSRHHDMDSMPSHYMSRGVGVGGIGQQSVDDDASSMDGSGKEKGRGSYKCGRCGVPKKGHVCPYQPKLKRRPDEPPPQTRSAAVQVEMDEFMTLRRLNIKIQGFPESYATEPYMTAESMLLTAAAAADQPLQHHSLPPMPPELMQPQHPHMSPFPTSTTDMSMNGNSNSGDMPIAETIESRDVGEGDGSLLDDEVQTDVAA